MIRRVGALALTTIVTLAPALLFSTARPANAGLGPPVLAYYYIWFDPSSWNHAKTDVPFLGKYSSDDANVMRQHIVWAKQAGIDGFIVSWKHTAVLDRRLALLADVAEQEHFALAIIYEGLDHDRNPLPVDTVASDLRLFAQNFAKRAPFALFRKPLVIWSGTWMYSAADIARVTAPLRRQLTLLASEKSTEGYERVAGAVDGDAYYWSSVDPYRNHDYLGKLIDIANSVHRNHGTWIAPAAAGFDARAIGGTSVVDRRNGDTFSRELTTAQASAADAIGVISWNEFSENSQIEPSKNFGFTSLDVLAQSLGREPRFASPHSGGADPTDSSASGSSGPPWGLVAAPATLVFGAIAAVAVWRRRATTTRLARERRRKRKRSHLRAADTASLDERRRSELKVLNVER